LDDQPDQIARGVLQAELERAAAVIRDRGSVYDRLLSVSAAIFAAGVSVGVGEGRSLVLVILPLPVVLLILFGFSSLIEQRAQGGYRRYLEERLSELNPTGLPSWERRVAPAIGHRSITDTYIMPGTYGAFFVGVWAVSLASAWADYRSWIFGLAAAMLLSVACVVVSLHESKVAGDRAYEVAANSG
jgi:hypothetical protein